LSCQSIKLIGERHRFTAFYRALTFADHVHEFDAGQNISSGAKGLEVEHGASEPLDRPMLNDVVRLGILMLPSKI
jgi:hypothetical protein